MTARRFRSAQSSWTQVQLGDRRPERGTTLTVTHHVRTFRRQASRSNLAAQMRRQRASRNAMSERYCGVRRATWLSTRMTWLSAVVALVSATTMDISSLTTGVYAPRSDGRRSRFFAYCCESVYSSRSTRTSVAAECDLRSTSIARSLAALRCRCRPSHPTSHRRLPRPRDGAD